jgi:hypothetical protein
MTFEDAAELVHDLSNKIAQLTEVKGEALSAVGSHAKALDTQAQALADDISFMLDELETIGFETIRGEL